MGNPPETTAPERGQPAALLNDVHFAERWNDGYARELRRVRNQWFSTGAVGDEAVLLGIMGVAQSVLWVTGSTLGFGGVLIASLVVLVPWRWKQRPRRHGSQSNTSYRVRVVGCPSDLERLRSAGGGVAGWREVREPMVFRIASAVESPTAETFKLVALCIGSSALMIGLEFVLYGEVLNGYVAVMVGGFTGRLTRAFFWPTYLRVSPRRLDVLQYPFLGAGSPRLRTYDLATCLIAMEIGGPLTVFREQGADGELFPSATPTLFNRDRLEFETCILAAAFARADAPAPLPEHALVG